MTKVVVSRAERELVDIWLRGLIGGAQAIRREVGDAIGAAAVMRLRAAADMECCAADLAELLPPDPPMTIILLPPDSNAKDLR